MLQLLGDGGNNIVDGTWPRFNDDGGDCTVMRLALGAQAREGPGRILSQQRPMVLRGSATNELIMGRVNVDDGAPG